MQSSSVIDILYLCCSIGSGLKNSNLKDLKFTEDQWFKLFRLCTQQGVLAIVFDAIMQLPPELHPPRKLKLQWAVSVEAIKKRYASHLKISTHIAEQFAKQNIQTIVIKGLAISSYYPNPEYREFGDLDCYLGKDYELGNQLFEQYGAVVDRSFYKNSEIKYKGLMIENHHFFLPVRGNCNMKSLERHLKSIVLNNDISFVPNTKLIIPTPDFNAIFLTAHSFNHFISEGIKLRQILDWALFLKAEQNNIDWKTFYYWSDKMHMTRFVDAITRISIETFGLKITNPAIHTSSPYSERILNDTIFHSEGINNKGYSAWKTRFMLILNKFKYSWKYHKIYQKSVIVELIKTVFAFVFEKNPKL